MPPPPGYLRFVDLCEFVGASANTVKKTLGRMESSGCPVTPHPSGTMKLFTPEQAEAIRDFHDNSDTTASDNATPVSSGAGERD